MARGPKPRVDRPTRLVVYIPASVSAKLDLLLYDPTKQQVKFGERSALVGSLLAGWIERMGAARPNVPSDSGINLHNERKGA